MRRELQARYLSEVLELRKLGYSILSISKKLYKQTFIICSFVCFVLLLLVLMLCCELPKSFLQRSTVAAVVMLLCSLLMLAIDVKTQLKWISIASNNITNNKVFKFVLNKVINRSKNDSLK